MANEIYEDSGGINMDTEPTLDECRAELRQMFPRLHTDAWATNMRNQPAFVVRVRGAHFFGDKLSECMTKVRGWQEVQERQARSMRPDRDDVPQRGADPLARTLSKELRQAETDRKFLLGLINAGDGSAGTDSKKGDS